VKWPRQNTQVRRRTACVQRISVPAAVAVIIGAGILVEKFSGEASPSQLRMMCSRMMQGGLFLLPFAAITGIVGGMTVYMYFAKHNREAARVPWLMLLPGLVAHGLITSGAVWAWYQWRKQK
jgi:hypothetical protein